MEWRRIVVLAVAAIRARSVALTGFGLDSLIEIGASTVVLWELADTGQTRQPPRKPGPEDSWTTRPCAPRPA